jgi:hypothetical protein
MRSLIRPTSTCGVLIPLFDFFWQTTFDLASADHKAAHEVKPRKAA